MLKRFCPCLTNPSLAIHTPKLRSLKNYNFHEKFKDPGQNQKNQIHVTFLEKSEADILLLLCRYALKMFKKQRKS